MRRPSSGRAPDEYQAALQDAQQAMLDRDAALRAGDLTAFAEADDRLTEAVERLIALGEQPSVEPALEPVRR